MGCVAGSFAWSHLLQSVLLVPQLRERGVSEEAAEKLLDSAPQLAFSVYYGGRFDCEAEVKVSVECSILLMHFFLQSALFSFPAHFTTFILLLYPHMGGATFVSCAGQSQYSHCAPAETSLSGSTLTTGVMSSTLCRTLEHCAWEPAIHNAAMRPAYL